MSPVIINSVLGRTVFGLALNLFLVVVRFCGELISFAVISFILCDDSNIILCRGCGSVFWLMNVVYVMF